MQKIKFNGYQIKLFMAFLMVFDHLSIIRGFISPDLQSIFHLLTRAVSVWFAYTAVEGVMYTKNLKSYNLRLFASAAVMFLGNSLVNFLYSSSQTAVHNNIFLTLACGVLMLTSIKIIPQRLPKIIISALIFTLGSLFTEGGMVILPFMLITYFTYGKIRLRNLCYLAFSLALFFANFQVYDTLSDTLNMLAFNSDFMFILVIPFLHLYNGKRGSSSLFSKYFFYAFYPAHLWIIATIGHFSK